MNIKIKATKIMTFKKAIEATADVKDCYQPGLKALGSNSSVIELGEPRQCEGSVDIDSCLSKQYPHDSRWDYTFGYQSKAYFVEVHPASTSEVETVIKKVRWLKSWLVSKAPKIEAIKNAPPYYWIQSGRFDILSGSKQSFRLAQENIRVVSKLRLP